MAIKIAISSWFKGYLFHLFDNSCSDLLRLLSLARWIKLLPCFIILLKKQQLMSCFVQAVSIRSNSFLDISLHGSSPLVSATLPRAIVVKNLHLPFGVSTKSMHKIEWRNKTC